MKYVTKKMNQSPAHLVASYISPNVTFKICSVLVEESKNPDAFMQYKDKDSNSLSIKAFRQLVKECMDKFIQFHWKCKCKEVMNFISKMNNNELKEMFNYGGINSEVFIPTYIKIVNTNNSSR